MKTIGWLGAMGVALGVVITAPALTRLAGALVTLIVVVGLIVALLRIVWFYTR